MHTDDTNKKLKHRMISKRTLKKDFILYMFFIRYAKVCVKGHTKLSIVHKKHRQKEVNMFIFKE